MSLGPLMIDLKGCELEPVEREMLLHPLCGGLILFSRNFESPEQIQVLIQQVHALRNPGLLIAVDHEGGAVQRFHEGFTRLPACQVYGREFDKNHQQGLLLSEQGGWLMAAELRAIGVDFSFAPVLDIGVGISRVINDRAFHKNPETISRLTQAFVRGMKTAGMSAVGKHFPGHGSVEADSHHEIPVDDRPLVDLEQLDLIPFERLISQGLPALMPAHVTYPQVDDRPAGFSPFWLQEVLRNRLAFQGVIFSDDISMAGAAVIGDPLARTRAALDAGCDMVLVCNDPAAAEQVIDGLGDYHSPVLQARLMRMHGRESSGNWQELHESELWQNCRDRISQLVSEPELDLGDDELL